MVGIEAAGESGSFFMSKFKVETAFILFKLAGQFPAPENSLKLIRQFA